MNIALKKALIERGQPAYKTGFQTGINPTKISKFIMGLASPTKDERRRLSRALGKPEKHLFPEAVQ